MYCLFQERCLASREFAQHLVPPGKGVLGYGELMPKVDAVTGSLGYLEVDVPAYGLLAAQPGYGAIAWSRRG